MLSDAECVSKSILYNDVIDELISHGYKYGEKSKLGAPIYIIKDKGLKHYIEYIRNICEIDKRFLGDDNFQYELMNIFDKPLAFATLVSKACIVNGEYQGHRLKYAVILNTDGICSSVQKKNVLYHEIGHCINDDPYYKYIADDDKEKSDSKFSCEVPKSNDDISHLDEDTRECVSRLVDDLKDRMPQEIKADFYAYNKTKTDLGAEEFALGCFKGLKFIISANEKLFNEVIKDPDCVDEYSFVKNNVFTKEGNEYFTFDKTYFKLQLTIRRLGIKYLMKNKTLDGFSIFDKI